MKTRPKRKALQGERDAGALRKRLAQNLRRLREERQLTLMRLGALAKLHWRHIQKLEARQCNTTLLTLARLCRALDVDVVELLAPLAEERRR